MPPYTGEIQGESTTDENSIVIVEGQILDHMGGGQPGVTVTVRYKGENDQPGEVVATVTTDQYGDFSVSVNEELHVDVVATFTKPMFTDLVKEIHVGHDDAPAFVSEILEGALSLNGMVIDEKTKKPIADATVVFKTYGRDIEEKTNAQGKFIIKELTPSPADLVIEAVGYGRETQTIHDILLDTNVTIEIKPERIVHVITLDEMEKPIPGVAVECYDRPRDDFRSFITDENGIAIFKGIHADAESLSLRISHDEFVSSSQFDQRIDLPSEIIESTHRITLTRAGKIAGQLLALETSKPIYGARVMTGDEYSDDSPRDWTNDDGHFTIVGVPPGSVAVTVHLSGYAPHLKVVEVKSGETTTLKLNLRNAYTLSGVVEDAEGKPVRGAFIETMKWRGRTTLNLRTMSNNEGKFTMENAPVDEFEISVRAAGHSQLQQMIKAGGLEPVVLKLTKNTGSGGASGTDIANVGQPAPDITVTSLDGKSYTISELTGKYVMLDFWATWCAPCVEEMSELVKVSEKFGSRDDFVMIGISRDLDKPSLEAFLKRNEKIDWPQVYGKEGGVTKAMDAYGVSSIPRIFLIGKDGKTIDKDLRGDMIFKSVEDAYRQNNPKSILDQNPKTP